VNADRILAAFHRNGIDCLLNLALREVGAQWGATDRTWAAVPEDWQWLQGQWVFCLTTEHGALDIFRKVEGLADFEACRKRASALRTEAGTPYQSLSDEDMLACQMALDERDRRLDRVAYLEKLLKKT
jgi:hypothetical protein